MAEVPDLGSRQWRVRVLGRDVAVQDRSRRHRSSPVDFEQERSGAGSDARLGTGVLGPHHLFTVGADPVSLIDDDSVEPPATSDPIGEVVHGIDVIASATPTNDIDALPRPGVVVTTTQVDLVGPARPKTRSSSAPPYRRSSPSPPETRSFPSP